MKLTLDGLMNVATTYSINMKIVDDRYIDLTCDETPPEAVIDVLREGKPLLIDFLVNGWRDEAEKQAWVDVFGTEMPTENPAARKPRTGGSPND